MSRSAHESDRRQAPRQALCARGYPTVEGPAEPVADLACVACCRGLAIRSILHGHGLLGLLEREGDDE